MPYFGYTVEQMVTFGQYIGGRKEDIALGQRLESSGKDYVYSGTESPRKGQSYDTNMSMILLKISYKCF